MKKFNPEEPLRCSFCHKTQEQVEKLISSPSDYPRAYICNECVGVCQTILEDEKREQATAPAKRLPRPPEIKQFLDGYVIGQDRTKKEAGRRRLQPLQAHFSQQAARRSGAQQVQHSV